MLNSLIDEPGLVYALLGTAALLLAFGAWKSRGTAAGKSRGGAYWVGAATALLLMGVLFLLGKLIETDRKQIERKMFEMAANIEKGNLERIFAHVSDSFRYNSLDKAEFRQRTGEALRRRNVTSVTVWDVEIESLSRANRKATVQFLAKPFGNWGSRAYYLIRAECVLEADDQWRLNTFQIYNPYVETQTPIAIPGF